MATVLLGTSTVGATNDFQAAGTIQYAFILNDTGPDVRLRRIYRDTRGNIIYQKPALGYLAWEFAPNNYSTGFLPVDLADGNIWVAPAGPVTGIFIRWMADLTG